MAMLGVATDRLPDSWDRAVRWYRRASRERPPRATVGAAVEAILDELRGAETTVAPRGHYRERDGDWAATVVARLGLGDEQQLDLGRAKDAAHGLRWLELVRGLRLDLWRSLVLQVPLALLA